MTTLPHRLLLYDRRFSRAIARWNDRTLIRWPVFVMSISGQSAIWLIIGLFLAWQGAPLGINLLLAVAAALIMTQLLKGVFRRPRPTERRLPVATNKYAFPSGHALRVGAVASTVALHYPSVTVACAVWALLVALSRVARTAHYLSDVLVGLLLGVALGGGLYLL